MNTLRTALLSSAFLFAACNAQPGGGGSSGTTPTSGTDPARAALTQWTGYYGGTQAPSVRVLRTAAEWDGFWRQMQRPSPRSLDPAREMGVVVFLGERRTGGYGVEIVRVAPRDQKLVVEYRESTPAPDMMVTQALTTPWAATVVLRSDLPVEPQKLDAAPARRSK